MIIYYKGEDALFQLEIEENSVFLHCDIYEWNTRTLRKGYSVFKTLIEELKGLGFNRMCTLTPNPKFAKLFGGISIKKFNHEGKKHEVVIWEF